MKKLKAEEELRDFRNAIAPKLKKESIEKRLEFLKDQLIDKKEEVIEIKSFEGLAKFL